MSAISIAALWQRAWRSAIFFGGLSTIVRLGASLLLLPLILEKLGTEEQALWWVFLALGALSNLADLGFGQAIFRVYSYLYAGAEDFETEGLSANVRPGEPNLPRLLQFNSTVSYFYRTLAVGAGVVLLLVGPFFVAPSRGHVSGVWAAYFLYVAILAYSFRTSFWALACQGLNRTRDLQLVLLWSGLAFLFTAAVLLLLDAGLFAMVVATAVRAVISHWMSARVVRAALGIRPDDARPDLGMLRKLWPNAWKFGAVSLAVYLVQHGTTLICRTFLGSEATASFGLTAQVGLFIFNLAGLWLSVKWPQITILRAEGQLRAMSALFARRLAFALASYTIMALLVVLFGNYLLSLRGGATRLLPTACLIVYLAYLGQQLFSSQFVTLTYTENVVPFYRIAIATGIGLVLLSLVLTPRFGLWGLILSPVIAAAACTSWYPVWRGFNGQPLTVGEFVKAAITGR